MSAKIGARSHPVYQRLCDLKKSGNAGRYGLLFSTQFKNYFYDTGTGKVLHIGDYEFKALQAFFDPTISLDAFEKRCHQMAGDRLEKFLTTIFDCSGWNTSVFCLDFLFYLSKQICF